MEEEEEDDFDEEQPFIPSTFGRYAFRQQTRLAGWLICVPT